jgi:site-specific DNA-cytosine methylase
LKELEYSFVPGEKENDATLRGTIEDLFKYQIRVPNHDIHSTVAKSNSGRRVFQDSVMTWAQVQQTFAEKQDNKALHYYNEAGEKKHHFGFRKPNYDKGSPTLIGTHPVIHPITNLPTSIRERARIQGFPDDFIFYGTVFEEDGTWVHNKNGRMIQQTGRCIPVEFPGFLIDQFQAFLSNDPGYSCSCRRLAKPNKYVDQHN